MRGINQVVDHTHLDLLHERMSADLDKIRALPVVPHNFVWGNIQRNYSAVLKHG